jgi:hypothetical protein
MAENIGKDESGKKETKQRLTPEIVDPGYDINPASGLQGAARSI